MNMHSLLQNLHLKQGGMSHNKLKWVSNIFFFK